MKIQIKHKIDSSIIFECDAKSIKIAVEMAIKAKADLSNSDLHGADLSGSNLRGADLSGSDLSGSNFRDSNMSQIKNDFWAILSVVPKEVSFLRHSLINGKINGSTYKGVCTCLIGTIANAQRCNYKSIENLQPDCTRPAERFFLAIKEGDTPKNNQFSELAVQWIEEWESNEANHSNNAG